MMANATMNNLSADRHARAQQRDDGERKGDVGGHGNAEARLGRGSAVRTRSGSAPARPCRPTAANAGSSALRSFDSSPT